MPDYRDGIWGLISVAAGLEEGLSGTLLLVIFTPLLEVNPSQILYSSSRKELTGQAQNWGCWRNRRRDLGAALSRLR